ncbi:MAG: DinB family protein [Gemmatimonadales bacterium]|nr:MAG: DinB family protein [Gemmatimonadales bacterium]
MPSFSPARPAASEYYSFYQPYITAAPDGDLLTALRDQRDSTTAVLAGISDTQAGFRYAEGKWSIREVVGHVSDVERVFSCRALRIARGDTIDLPGFDENVWVPMAGFEARSMADVATEFRAVREATLALFGSFSAEAWLRIGSASGHPASARALGWIVAGHELHHHRVLAERYFPHLKP